MQCSHCGGYGHYSIGCTQLASTRHQERERELQQRNENSYRWMVERQESDRYLQQNPPDEITRRMGNYLIINVGVGTVSGIMLNAGLSSGNVSLIVAGAVGTVVSTVAFMAQVAITNAERERAAQE